MARVVAAENDILLRHDDAAANPRLSDSELDLLQTIGEIRRLCIPLAALRQLVTDDAVLGETILRAFLIRRSTLIGHGLGVKVIGEPSAPETRRLVDFLARNRVPHSQLELDDTDETGEGLREFSVAAGDLPLVVLGARILRIENYPGFPAGISGGELAARTAVQATKFGFHIVTPAQAVSLTTDGDPRIRLRDGTELAARAVLIATGARYRGLQVPRIDELQGAGVYFAATQAEATGCEDGVVVVVGGGNSAGQAALFLAQSARQVELVIRRRSLDETMSRYLIDRLERDERIEVRPQTEVHELLGEARLSGVVLETRSTGQRAVLDACRSRRRSRVSSPPAMCAAARPSGSRQPSAKAQWRSTPSTSVSACPQPTSTSGVRCPPEREERPCQRWARRRRSNRPKLPTTSKC